jgi:hypothetical protein
MNQRVSKTECDAIRKLTDFDMKMLVGDIHDHGWPVGRVTLRITPGVEDMFDDFEQVQREGSEYLLTKRRLHKERK